MITSALLFYIARCRVMRMFVKVLLFFILLPAVPGLTIAQESFLDEMGWSETRSAEVLAGPMGGLGDAQRPSVLPAAENGWLRLYANDEGRVVFVGPEGEHVTLDDDSATRGGAWFRLVRDDQRLYAFWWAKLDDATKRLYLRVSGDGGNSFGELQTINSDGQVLGDYDVHVVSNGKLIVTYTDERSPHYQVYMNRTVDGGETWLPRDVRLDTAPLPTQVRQQKKNAQNQFAVMGSTATESRVVQVGERILVLWKEGRMDVSDEGPVSRVVLRYSDDYGVTWSDDVPIHSRVNRPPVADEVVVEMPDGTLIVGVFDYPEGLLAYRSNDRGESWESLSSLPGSSAYLAFSQFQAAAHGDDVTFLYTVNQKNKKLQVHAATLDSKSGEWLTPESAWVAQKPFEEMQSWNPTLVALPSGQLVAAWEDYRAIRPSVRVQVSKDGVNWSEEFLAVHEPGKFVEGWPRLGLSEGEPYVTYFRWEDDARRKRYLLGAHLLVDGDGALDLQALHGMSLDGQKVRKERLAERVSEYWKARVEARHADAYDYFDPAYRANVSEVGFLATQGNVVFKSYDMKEVLVWDTIGGAILDIQFSVPSMEVNGQEFSVPLKTDEYRQEWVWVYDDWYVVYESALGNRNLEY